MEWVTPAENTLHSYRVLGNKMAQGASNGVAMEYLIETPAGEKIRIKGINSFCRQMKLDPHSMHRSLNDGKKHRGYRMLARLTTDKRKPHGHVKRKLEQGATQ